MLFVNSLVAVTLRHTTCTSVASVEQRNCSRSIVPGNSNLGSWEGWCPCSIIGHLADVKNICHLKVFFSIQMRSCWVGLWAYFVLVLCVSICRNLSWFLSLLPFSIFLAPSMLMSSLSFSFSLSLSLVGWQLRPWSGGWSSGSSLLHPLGLWCPGQGSSCWACIPGPQLPPGWWSGAPQGSLVAGRSSHRWWTQGPPQSTGDKIGDKNRNVLLHFIAVIQYSTRDSVSYTESKAHGAWGGGGYLR